MLPNPFSLEERELLQNSLLSISSAVVEKYRMAAQLAPMPDDVQKQIRDAWLGLIGLSGEIGQDNDLRQDAVYALYQARLAIEGFIYTIASNQALHGNIPLEHDGNITGLLNNLMALGGMPDNSFFNMLASRANQDTDALKAFCQRNAETLYTAIGSLFDKLQDQPALQDLEFPQPCALVSMGLSLVRREIHFRFEPYRPGDMIQAAADERFSGIVGKYGDGALYIADSDHNGGRLIFPGSSDMSTTASKIVDSLRDAFLINQPMMDATLEHFGLPPVPKVVEQA